jgi:hypothetical protein
MRYQCQMFQLLIGDHVRVGEVTHINNVGLGELIKPGGSNTANRKVADPPTPHFGEAVRNEPLTA